jgi:hypothetical protein
MDVLVFFLVALILLAVVLFVVAPLRAPASSPEGLDDPRLAELEARKEAKYREIRDAELDHAAGKLSERDWRRQDAELRREAIQILRELDGVRAKTAE